MSYPCQSKKFLHNALHFWRAKKDIESHVWYSNTPNVWFSPFCSNYLIHLPDPLSFWPILRRKCNYNTIMNMWLSMFLNSCWVQTADWAWHDQIFFIHFPFISNDLGWYFCNTVVYPNKYMYNCTVSVHSRSCIWVYQYQSFYLKYTYTTFCNTAVSRL